MRSGRNRGFALLEATCAIFVATIGVFGVLQMFSAASDEIRTINEKEIAGRLLRNEMDYVLSQRFDALAPVIRDTFVTPAPELERLHDAATRVEISDDEDLPNTLRVVTIGISWTSTHSRRVEQSLATLVAREAPQ